MIPGRLNVVTLGAGDVPSLRAFDERLGWTTNSTGDEFGKTRLQATIQDNLDNSPGQLMHCIIDDLNSFTGTTTLPDDLCLVAVEIVCDLPKTAND